MDSFADVFLSAKDGLRGQLSTASYNLFISDLTFDGFENDTVTVVARSEFIKNQVEQRFKDLLEHALTDIMGFAVSLSVAVPATQHSVLPAVQQNGGQFTFQNFIVGSTNRFAHAAAQAVASNPSGAYNPLFIYGGSGLGKTHLLNAIRNEISGVHPDFNIVYVDGEKFTNEIIAAIRNNSTNAFHQKYRAADVLLVDDIQFIGGKESTQEEFFHTFNALYNAGKQIVLVSDRPPREIKSLEERLRTRFESGLTADIAPPDFETRVAIINRKAESLNFEIPPEVSEYISTRLKSDIRQLEGVVKKISAFYKLEGMTPSISVAQVSIKDILNENQPAPVTIEKIIKEVSRTFNVSALDIKGRSRAASISNARKIAMYIVRHMTDLSTTEIGEEFGGRDHSTVVYGTNDVMSMLEHNRHLNDQIEDIIKNVRS